MGKAAVKILAVVASALITSAASFAPSAFAQQAQPADNTKAARPLWSELSPKQQAVLAPIAAEWDKLDTTRRKKWVTIANRFPKMSAEEQYRLQTRMQDWASLTPAQRRVARENFQTLRQLPHSERGNVKQKWLQNQQKAAPAPAAEPATEAAK